MSVRFPFSANTRTAKARTARRPAWRAALGTVAAALTVPVALACAAAPASAATVRPSGLPWSSGVYLRNATPASVAAFGAWRGRPVDVVTAWSNRASWNDIVNPAFLYRRWHGTGKTLALGVAMIPEHVAGTSIKACAAGRYDSHWRQFGTTIAAAGLGRSVIRLGWEFNGDWYAWKATSPATWASCWRQIVTSARATAPDLQWDWNVNRGVSSGLADPARAYPGDAYVTTIGVDSYDMWPAAATTANWQLQLNGPQGLNY